MGYEAQICFFDTKCLSSSFSSGRRGIGHVSAAVSAAAKQGQWRVPILSPVFPVAVKHIFRALQTLLVTGCTKA